VSKVKLEEQSEIANRRQGYMSFFSIVFARWQHCLALPYLAMAKNHSILYWIQMIIRITTKI